MEEGPLAPQRWIGAYDKERVERFVEAATAERDRLRDELIALRTRRAQADQARAATVAEIIGAARRDAEAVRAAAGVRAHTILGIAESEAEQILVRARAAVDDPAPMEAS